MNRLLEPVVTLVVGAGLPISQLAIRRLGRPGAGVVTAVTAGILAADLANVAAGRSRGSVRRIVRLEAAVAGVATVTGAMLLLDPEVSEARDEGWRVGRPELVRRLSLGVLFGILSARLRVRDKAADLAAEGAGGAG